MYYYKIEDGDGECGCEVIVSHERSYTAEEFEKIVLDAIVKAVQEKHEENVQFYAEFNSADPPAYHDPFAEICSIPEHFEDVRDLVPSILCRDYGFSSLPIHALFACRSNISMLNESAWSGWQKNEQRPLAKLPKIFAEKGITQKLHEAYKVVKK